MATIKKVILKRIDKKGLTDILIAVCHKGKTAYISTGYKVDPKKYAQNKISPDININVELKIRDFNNRLQRITDLSVYPDASRLKEKLLSMDTILRSFMTVGEAFDIFIEADRKNGIGSKTNSAKNSIRSAKNAFLRFAGNTRYCINTLDQTTVKSFWKWLNTTKSTCTNKPYSSETVILYYSYLKETYNLIKESNKVKFDDGDPFAGIKLPKKIIRENFMSLDTFLLIKKYEVRGKRMTIAKDMFLLSFYLGGLNLADIERIDFRPDIIRYQRKKTENKINDVYKIKVFPEAREIINKYINIKTGLLELGSLGSISALFNKQFARRFVKDTRTNERITFYSARKCFATLATNMGINNNVVDYILGHSNKNKGIIAHYAQTMPELAEIAMQAVFELIQNPEDVKEVFKRNLMRQLYGR